MSDIASLEVRRPVFVDATTPFFEEVTGFKRAIFDMNGNGAYALRPSGDVHVTTRSGARAYSEEELHFCHAWLTSQNRHTTEKIINAGQKLKKSGEIDGRLREVRAKEFGQDPDLVVDLELDTIDFIEHPLRPRTLAFVLGVSANNPKFELLTRLSGVTHDVLAQTRAFSGMALSPAVGKVLFAETRVRDPLKVQAFAEHVGELLPIRVFLSPQAEPHTQF